MSDGAGCAEIVEFAAQRVEAFMLRPGDGNDFDLLGGDAAAGTALGFWLPPFWVGFHPIYQGGKGAKCPAQNAGVGFEPLTPSKKLALWQSRVLIKGGFNSPTLASFKLKEKQIDTSWACPEELHLFPIDTFGIHEYIKRRN